MRIIVTLSFIVVFLGCDLSYKLSKTDWTVAEAKEWSEKNKNYSNWHGWFLYQGSDSVNHHFISRIMDDWTWFNIKKTDLNLAEIKPYNKSSSAPLGYYYVDPNKDFTKVKEY